MAAQNSPYELTPDFRGAKAEIDKSLRDALQQDYEALENEFPSGHSQRERRIEDACCGHIARTAEKLWNELLETGSGKPGKLIFTPDLTPSVAGTRRFQLGLRISRADPFGRLRVKLPRPLKAAIPPMASA